MVIALATASLLTAGPQQPTFSTRVEAVRVDVLVTRDNRPITGLGAADFDVRDNGTTQQVEVVSLEQLPLNIVLALDLSESVAGPRLEQLQRAGATLLDALEPRDRAALITFNQGVALRCPLASTLECLRRAMVDQAAGGATALVDGAFAALITAESAEGRSLVMVFSDGLDTSSWLSAERVLDTTRHSEVVVYGISAGTARPPEFLAHLTETTGGRHLRLPDLADLADTFVSILNEFRHRYVLTYIPRGVERGGWHRLEVRVKRDGARVRARPGYFPRA